MRLVDISRKKGHDELLESSIDSRMLSLTGQATTFGRKQQQLFAVRLLAVDTLFDR